MKELEYLVSKISEYTLKCFFIAIIIFILWQLIRLFSKLYDVLHKRLLSICHLVLEASQTLM
jgi:hypothetical protein